MWNERRLWIQWRGNVLHLELIWGTPINFVFLRWHFLSTTWGERKLVNHLTSNPPHPLFITPQCKPSRLWLSDPSLILLLHFQHLLTTLALIQRCPMCARGECVLAHAKRMCCPSNLICCVQIFCSLILFGSLPNQCWVIFNYNSGLALCFSVFTLYILKLFHEKQTSLRAVFCYLVTILTSEDFCQLCV